MLAYQARVLTSRNLLTLRFHKIMNIRGRHILNLIITPTPSTTPEALLQEAARLPQLILDDLSEELLFVHEDLTD